MAIPPKKLRRLTGDHRYAIVSVEPATEPGTFMVRVARGLVKSELNDGTTYGPYPEADLQVPFDMAVKQLTDEGFHEIVAGWSQLERLTSNDPTERVRGAIRLMWRQNKAAVDPLLDLAEKAVQGNRGEACIYVDALGRLGDPRAIPIARRLAEKKNLSRRRSGVEALRNLGDKEGLAAARQRGFERLPPPVQQALQGIDESDEGSSAVEALVDAAKTCDGRRFGLIADVLYEAGTPVTVAAARRILAHATIERPHIWRYAKSVLKRAMLRRDARTFGFLVHAIERAAGKSHGTVATIKSGFDGQKKAMRVFSKGTQRWVRRACWRHLKDIAMYEPHRYARTAAEVIVHYNTTDMRKPQGLVGAYGHCYLLGRILWSGGDRVKLKSQTLRWAFRTWSKTEKKPGVREEAFPELWDAGREAYLRVLAGAKLPEVFQFGLDGIVRNPEVLQHASVKQLTKLLGAKDNLTQGTPLIDLVCKELSRRFDPNQPDFGLVMLLLASPSSNRVPVREMVKQWLTASAGLWTKNEQYVFGFPRAVDAGLRSHVAKLLITAFQSDSTLRNEYAPGMLAILQQPETEPGQNAAFATIARQALIAEMGALIDLPDLLKWLDEGSTSGRAVAGALLAARPDAVEALGLQRIVAMANDEVAAVRFAAQGILRQAIPQLQTNPAPLYALAESDWSDTRDVAFQILRDDIDIVALGLEGIIGLCDSNDPDVEELGRELVVKHFESLNAEEVLFRLSEHPSQKMRLFALGLMHVHLRGGYVPLARLERYFRAVLFDAWPSRRLKYGVVELLLRRGMNDENQGAFAAKLFDEILRTNTKGDFDRVAFALACLQVKFPSIETELKMQTSQPEAAE